MLVKALRTSTKLVSNLSTTTVLYMHVINTFDIIYIYPASADCER
jgi:hypothetical protein